MTVIVAIYDTITGAIDRCVTCQMNDALAQCREGEAAIWIPQQFPTHQYRVDLVTLEVVPA